MTSEQQNPLAVDKISSLILRFSVPSIIAMLVSAVYNIADQLFIGNAVGTLGNAATNIAFPLAMMCTGLGLLFGIGGAASFNLHMGAGKKEKAPYFVGNAITMLLTVGILLFAITELFLNPLLVGFGSPADVLPLARQYVRVTAIGFPFLILTIGSGHLIRADGSPKMAMFVNISGAVINIGCRVCSGIPLGHVRCCSGNRDRSGHLCDYCGLLSVTLPHSNPALQAFPAECFPSGTDLLTWHGFCHQPGCHDDRADYDEQPAKTLRCTVRLRRVNSDCLFRNCHESQPALLFRDYRPVTGQPADPEF